MHPSGLGRSGEGPPVPGGPFARSTSLRLGLRLVVIPGRRVPPKLRRGLVFMVIRLSKTSFAYVAARNHDPDGDTRWEQEHGDPAVGGRVTLIPRTANSLVVVRVSVGRVVVVRVLDGGLGGHRARGWEESPDQRQYATGEHQP